MKKPSTGEGSSGFSSASVVATLVRAVLTLDVEVGTSPERPFAVLVLLERLGRRGLFPGEDYPKTLVVWVVGGVWQEMHSVPSVSTAL